MFSEDWNRTSQWRLFHVRYNMGTSHSTSQVFHMDISVQGPAPVLETGRALLGRDAEHQALTEATLQRTFSPQASYLLSTSKQRQTGPFFLLSHLLSARKKIHKTVLHPQKMEVKDPEKCPQDSGICSCPPPWSKATRTFTVAPMLGESVSDEHPTSLQEKRILQERTGLGYPSTYCTNPGHIQKYRQ